MLDKRTLLLLFWSGTISLAIIYLDFTIFFAESGIFTVLLITAVSVFALPIIVIKYDDYRKTKEIEENFTVFLRDFVESVRSGMTIPQAFKSVSSNDYKALSFYVKKMSAQLDWGITVDKVFTSFSKESKSKLIKRIISSIIESHKFGGNLTDTLEALGNTALEVERLRAERKLYLQSQMITGYMIYFVFLVVLIVLERFLIPSLSEAGSSSLTNLSISQPIVVEEYKTMFRNLIIIQGFFAGLTVGKLAEGALIAGLKHSLFMVFVGITVYMIAA